MGSGTIKKSSRVMTFEQNKRIPLFTHIERFRDEGVGLYFVNKAGNWWFLFHRGGVLLGKGFFIFLFCVTWEEISGLQRISTLSNGIGWALGCLVCFLSFAARRWELVARAHRCFGGCKYYRAYVHVILPATIFLSLYYGFRLGGERIYRFPCHFFRIIPPAKVSLPMGQQAHHQITRCKERGLVVCVDCLETQNSPCV